MAPLIAVAVSGGVDSTVAAHLLKRGGHDLVGLHFLHGHEADGADEPAAGPRRPADARVADIAGRLGLPVETVDLGDVFDRTVVDGFVAAYRRGRTPNPCTVCNQRIKFGALLEAAGRLGAAKLATGHYARRDRDTAGRCRLFRGRDPLKDQSYFLAFLNQRQLGAALFPVGGMTKAGLRRYAATHGLDPARPGESQDICFIRQRSYGEFIAARRGFTAEPGLIEEVGGRVIGEHGGLHLFTVGQRRGINCPARRPYYVVRLDTRRNRLVVGPREALGSEGCRVSGVNWIAPPPGGPIEVKVRLRYRGAAVDAALRPLGGDGADLRFGSPQYAVTPGQAAVFYRGEEVLGGGWIDAPTGAS